MRIKITDAYSYRDGGTKSIETENGIYWLPGRAPGVFFGEDYFKGKATEVTDPEEIAKLIHALAEDSCKLQWIKRHVK